MNLLQCHTLPIKRCTLIILGILFHASTLVAQDTSRFVGLGHLAGGTASHAAGVSANGLVVVAYEFGANTSGFLWTEAGGIQELPLYLNVSGRATGVSGDGSVVVGYVWGGVPGAISKALRWAGGTVSALAALPVSPPVTESAVAYGISYDGTRIVGFGNNNSNQYEALLWDGGVHGLGFLPGGNSSVAGAISPDGSVIVGQDRLYYAPNQPYTVAFRSVSGGGLQSLGTGGYYQSQALGVSSRGEVIVGALIATAWGPNTAARWTASGGWEVLQGTSGSSSANAVSVDGSIIAGSMDGRTKAFIWDRPSCARDLKSVLENEYHLDLSEWTLTDATAVDSTGTVIVGEGMHNGMTEAWWARLSPLHITKPSADSLWIAGEKDTIKWIGGKKDQILIVDYSIDSGKTFSLLDFVGSADTGMYVWTPPRDFISKKCFIRIVDFNDQK